MEKNHLYILWTNDNAITAEHMVMLYSENAMLRNWWDKVTVIIWGATAKLAAEDSNIQGLITQGRNAGVEYTGCLHCATQLGAAERLTALGVELKYWGEPLTDLIKNNEHMITV